MKTGKDFLLMFLDNEELPQLNPVLETVVLAAMAAFAQYREAHPVGVAAPAGEEDWIEWVEPFGVNSEPVYLRIAKSVAVARQKQAAATKHYAYESDERALQDFLTVNWAYPVSRHVPAITDERLLQISAAHLQGSEAMACFSAIKQALKESGVRK